MSLFIIIPIGVILFAGWLLLYYFPRQARKEHEDYMKDDRDVTDTLYDDEPYAKYFKK